MKPLDVCSPDGAERNPGFLAHAAGPRISLTLHPGYIFSFGHTVAP
jgi:hypothetical protein